MAPDPPINLSVLECTKLDPYHLHEQDVDVQELYATWSINRPQPPAYDPSLITTGRVRPRDTWTIKAAAAWILARQLGDNEFERYALAQFIQTCSISIFGPWEFIEARCPQRSSILRFANHWIAWNESLNTITNGNSEFKGLYATTLVGRVVEGETRDPRTLDLDHWFMVCGDDLAAKCAHDPIARMAKVREMMLPKVPEVVSQVGRDEELHRKPMGIGNKGVGSTSSSPFALTPTKRTSTRYRTTCSVRIPLVPLALLLQPTENLP
jgi:hypothetical protein